MFYLDYFVVPFPVSSKMKYHTLLLFGIILLKTEHMQCLSWKLLLLRYETDILLISAYTSSLPGSSHCSQFAFSLPTEQHTVFSSPGVSVTKARLVSSKMQAEDKALIN